MGPLAGLRVIELAGIGPAPFCGMLLADLGADVVRIERMGSADLGIHIERQYDLLNRGKRSIAVDLKQPDGVTFVLDLVEKAEVLIEGFRPGVTERLGIGPDICLERNPALVYGRMTGWGQQGPLAAAAGHDINYIALTGALHAIGRKNEAPFPPLNLVGDFGGGALYLAVGVLAAALSARQSGQGQVVDAAMVDGAAHLMTLFYGLLQMGSWRDERGSNVLDGGAYYYGVYQTRGGDYISVGSIEKRFHDELLSRMGFNPADFDQHDTSSSQKLESRLRERFLTKTRDEWRAVLEGTDVCFAPVLNMEEAPKHPHMIARQVFVESGDVLQPAPAPRFSRTATSISRPPPKAGEHGLSALRDWQEDAKKSATLIDRGIIAAH